jgi:hypothetical protein
MEREMSVLTHTQDVPPAFHEMRKAKNVSRPAATAPSSHAAMIKRFARFTGALLMMVLVVAAVGGIKLAFYWPHFAH